MGAPGRIAPNFAELVRMDPAEAQAFIGALEPEQLEDLRHAWWFWARPEQLWASGPETWTVGMAGRGWGKTRWAVETCLAWGADERQTGGHMIFVGATNSDVQGTMLYGKSGFMTLGRDRPGMKVRHYKGEYQNIKVSVQNSRGGWVESCSIRFASAEKPGRMRGPEVGRAWYDELGVFPLQRAADNVWAQRTFVCRLPVAGGPKGIVSMTPKPTAEVKALLAEAYEPRCPAVRGNMLCGAPTQMVREFAERTCPKCGHRFWPEFRVIRGKSSDNAAHLAPEQLAALDRLRGTRLYIQEAEGELVDDVEGQMFLQPSFVELRSHLERGPGRAGGDTHEQAVRRELDLHRIVVAVDPSGSTSKRACESGVVVSAMRNDTVVVCEDATVRPDQVPAGATMSATYATAAADAAWRWGAEVIAIETNNGGDAVIQVLESAVDEYWRAQQADAYEHPKPLVIAIWAHASKAKRAEFMSVEQSAGRVVYLALAGEDWRSKWSPLMASMTGFSPLTDGGLRDRMDAVVHSHRALHDPASLGSGRLPPVSPESWPAPY